MFAMTESDPGDVVMMMLQLNETIRRCDTATPPPAAATSAADDAADCRRRDAYIAAVRSDSTSHANRIVLRPTCLASQSRRRPGRRHR